nr:unnamed protein product [Spirometra erinaceieuropaei]
MNGDVAMTNFTVPTMDYEAIAAVADQFVMQYYTVMNKCPQQLHRFYSHDSSVIHEDAPIFGQENIFNAFKDMPLSDTRVLIHKVDALRSVQNTILVQVCGEISIAGAPPRRFMRSFTLREKNARNFYVLNDIFHYQDRVFIPEGHNAEPEHVQPPEPIEKPRATTPATNGMHQAENWQTQQPPAPKPQTPVAPEPEPAPIEKEVPPVPHQEPPKEAEHQPQLLTKEPVVPISAPSPPPTASAPANTARMSWAERASAQKTGPPPPQPRRGVQNPNPGSDAHASVPVAQRTALMTRGGQPNRPGRAPRPNQPDITGNEVGDQGEARFQQPAPVAGGRPSGPGAMSCDPPFEGRVADVIQKQQNHRTPEADGISAKIYKSTLALWLHEKIGQAWSDKVVSDDWESSILVPVFKKTTKTKCENYRDFAEKALPIVLLRRLQAARD